MLHKTRGIVLHNLPYNDKYRIVTLYTQQFGRIAYMVTNSRSKKNKMSHALMQPLSALELEVEHLNNRDLQRIKEVKPGFIITQIQINALKSVIALFLSEFLYRVIQEKEANHALFDYLWRSIHWLEIADAGIANFHLAFLLQLSVFFGIRPSARTYSAGSNFDLRNGVFSETIPQHDNFLNVHDSLVFERLLRMNYENMPLYSFTRQERVAIVRQIIEFYRLHLSDFPEIKSLAVMQSLFDG